MTNSIINSIQNNEANRQIFAPILNNAEKNLGAVNFDRVDRFLARNGEPVEEETTKKSLGYKLAIAGGVALLLGGVGMIVGRNGNYGKMRKAVFTYLKTFEDKKAARMTLGFADKVKGYAAKGLSVLFSLDKFKDHAAFSALMGLGLIGRKFADFTRKTAWFPEKLFADKNWEKAADAVRPQLDEALKISELDDATKNALERLSNGNIVGKVAEGFSDRKVKIRQVAEDISETFNRSYFPQGNIISGEFWKGIPGAFDRILAQGKKGEDLIMAEWKSQTRPLLIKEIENTGDFGEVMSVLRKSDNEKVRAIVKTLEDAMEKEVERYGGRVRDLALGGGVTEILAPTVAAGIIAHNTRKGETTEERVDNFVKGGGIGITAGLGVWAVTMLMAINGPLGMLVGLASGFGLDAIGKSVYKSIRGKQEL